MGVEAGAVHGRHVLRDLQGIVGESHALEASEADAVDGVVPGFVAEPATIEEAREVMALAGRPSGGSGSAGLAVVPRGAGSKLHWGNPPSRLDLILSTRRLNRVLEHAAGDLVVRAEPGVTLESLQRTVAAAGQRLALDPPEPGATLGGIVAANASGPRRLRFGTARDLLIGITYVLPNGTVARAGGKVVKNVAGYDLGKLFTGSLGTLGLLVETIFRLHPLPAMARTVVLRGVDRPEDLGAAVQAILHSPLVPSALEFTWDARGTLAVLFEGIEPGVAAQVEGALQRLRPLGDLLVLGEEEQASWWDGSPGWQRAAGAARLKIAVVPGDLPHMLRHVIASADRRGAGRRLHGRAGTAVMFATLTADTPTLTEMIRDIRREAAGRGGSAVVLDAPAGVKRAVDVWGPVGDALPLMRRVKEQFDPDGIMSPGRFVGGL
ncbi:MAG: FAD-binding oxidoreductase [Chloroflexi bacterium]|nr:FAD-binding oxidoreductase [Chloroflexota bacterium]